MRVKIREATKDDAALLTGIIRGAFRDVAERFGLTMDACPRHPSNCTVEGVQSALEKGVTYYILENDGKPCGCVALERAGEGVCYLERLAVLPEFRRMGFGKALVEHVLGEASRIGARRVELGMIAKHTELKEWYENQGFAVKKTARFEELPFAVMFMLKEL
jgi:N-acetylglutamate synthase-like GNAT family acetyltransferase